MWRILQDPLQLEALLRRLGWFAPAALILLNAAQIVIAPIPGYVVQAVSGYLFGAFWGGIWSGIGLICGSMLAMWLARTYGKPLVGRLVGHARLERWETVTHSDRWLVWFVLILAPVGDIPYFLAGLANVSFRSILLLTLLIRLPTTFVVAAAGAGVMFLSWAQIVLLLLLLAGLLWLFMRYQDQILAWIDHRVRRMTIERNGNDGTG